jgi:hypothetical protein
MNRHLRADMRTFLLSAILSFGGFAGGAALPAQDPPAATEPVKLSPAEIELIKIYVDLRDAELQPHQDASQKIWRKYDDLIRNMLPTEKYRLARPLMGGC